MYVISMATWMRSVNRGLQQSNVMQRLQKLRLFGMRGFRRRGLSKRVKRLSCCGIPTLLRLRRIRN
ncbi:hypothetical protein D1872_284760 [compost metagenome]